MQKVLRQKDEKIKELERKLAEKEDRIQELTSKLDKYQSVVHVNGTRQRAMGISASPQPLRSLQDFEKDIKTVHKSPR